MFRTAFYLLLLIFSTALWACTPAKKTVSATATATTETVQKMDPIFHLDTPTYDLGTIKLGDKPTYSFSFTNTSGEDLEIELVSGCHCTTIDWPKGHVFKPGEKGEIKILYDSELEEGLGAHNKTIDILLEKTDPVTGYQVIKEAKFTVFIEEK